MEPPETDTFLSLTWPQAEVRERLGFESELPGRRDEVKTVSWRLDKEMWRQPRFAVPTLWWAPKKGRTPDEQLWRRNQQNKYVRTATENQKENSRSVSTLSVSPHDMLFLFVQQTRVT